MGIETAALMAYATAATAAVGVYSALNQPKPEAPKIPAPEKPPQASKQPDQAAISTKNATAAMAGGSMSGNAGTFLTGSTGVDPNTLTLGKNTLLGQ